MKKTNVPEPVIALTAEKLKKNWRDDLLSGLLIFLIALPLSLGIAIGSSFPPMAGIIAAVVGGLVVSIFAGSHLIIAGPAAGLIVVIVHGVDSLGGGDLTLGYTATLAAIAIAGLITMTFGLLKSGKLSTFFPGAVVHGMMAAIGIIIIAKQIHTLFGVKPAAKDIVGIIAEIPHTIMNLNPEVTIIGVTSLLMLIFIPKLPIPFVKKIPVPMLVVIAGIIFDKAFDLEHEHMYTLFSHDYQLGPKFLVQLPARIMDGIVFPNWSLIATGKFWFVTISIALVQSLESLLTSSAIQGLDPLKRKSNFDKDLIALGMGTTISGMLGGLPMIAEVIRSSANVNNGAKTPWSNFFHGSFLLVFVIFFPWLLQEVPLSSLAALLVFAGWRLGSPKEFMKIYNIGSDQLVIFTSTVLVTVTVDLLAGVGFGILVKIIIHALRGLSPRHIFLTNIDINDRDSEVVNIKILNAAIFWSIFKVKDNLYSLPNAKVINVDVSDCKVVDHSMMEFFDHFRKECAEEGVQFNLTGLENKKEKSGHMLAARRIKS
jgi:MFS superfamily sulfate permease-like transporter